MSIKPIGSGGLTFQTPPGPALIHRAVQLLQKCSNPVSASSAEISKEANELIQELSQLSESNRNLCIKGLSILLRVPNYETQNKIVLTLAQVIQVIALNIHLLPRDLDEEHLLCLSESEKEIYEALITFAKYSPPNSFIPQLIEIQQNVIERIYFLSLIENNHTRSFIIDKIKPLMIEHIDSICALLQTEKEPEIALLLGETKRMVVAVGKVRVERFNEMLQTSTSTLDWIRRVIALGRQLGLPLRASYTCHSSLKCLDILDILASGAIGQHKDLSDAIEITRQYVYRSLCLCYWDLGDIYHSLKASEKAVDAFLQLVSFASRLTSPTQDDRVRVARAYVVMGTLYRDLGHYERAIIAYKNAIEASHKIEDDEKRTDVRDTAYTGLIYIYNQIGEIFEAAKCWEHLGYHVFPLEGEKDTQALVEGFSRILELTEDENSSSSDKQISMLQWESVGGLFFKIKNYESAIKNYKKSFKIAVALKNEEKQMRCCSRIGHAYFLLGNNETARQFCEKAVAIAENVKDTSTKMDVYEDNGTLLYLQDEPYSAYGSFLKALGLANQFGEALAQAKILVKLGGVDLRLSRFSAAEKRFQESIHTFNRIFMNFGTRPQWQISFFEQQGNAYDGLTLALLCQNEVTRALETTNFGYCAALREAILKKTSVDSQPLTCDQMQELALKLNTTFIVFSCLSLPGKKNINVWIVPPKGKIIWQPLPIDSLPENMESEILQQFPYVLPPTSERPVLVIRGEEDSVLDPALSSSSPDFLKEVRELDRGDGNTPLALEVFKKQLSQWHDAFISPIEAYLPTDPQQTVTIIPDGLLSHIPFAAFRDKSGKYLIEKHPLLMAPSIQVLHLLNQLPKEFSSIAVVVGNPTSPHASALEKSEEEAEQIVSPLLDHPKEKVLVKKNPTVTRVKKEMDKARWIHLACHGEICGKPEDKPDLYSVFEGFFKLVPDEEHEKGYLHAQEIATLSLNAELVFLSACFSGRGKLQREGSVGPIWSFLAAGALSTIATYWKLPDSQLTLDMVKTFYSHVLGKDVEKLSKARSLQRAMLQAIATERENPHKWAAFFLSGLDMERNENSALKRDETTGMPLIERSTLSKETIPKISAQFSGKPEIPTLQEMNPEFDLTPEKLLTGFKEEDKHFTAQQIAKLLWLDPTTIISEDMVEKVNTIAAYLYEQAFKLKGVLADGNCFCNAFLGSYRMLSRKIPLLDNAENKVLFLREQIAGMIGKKDIDRAQEIRTDMEWITAFDEGDLLAKALKLPIRIITVNKDEKGCGVSDLVTFTDSGKPQQDWKSLNEKEELGEYTLIVDLGGHFVYGIPFLKYEDFL